MWLAFGHNPTWALSPHPFSRWGPSDAMDLCACSMGLDRGLADGTTIVNYSWNFGDGTMASGREVSHEFLATGA